MKTRPVLAAAGAAALLATAWTGTAAAAPSTSTVHGNSRHVCGTPAAGHVSCNAIVRTDVKGKPSPQAAPSGYGPADIQKAYGLGGASSNTVAIVDAYNDPTAANDLAVYRSQYGLPACGSGCFTQVNQTGGSALPATDTGWAQEISLDLDMVSAACPSCKILLVEANSSSFADLGAAVNYAASVPGVAAISNSYGGSDAAQGNVPGYDHPGIAITASTGDNGYGVESPASFKTVIAVGGTSLTRSTSSRGFTESAWSGAGSGCSTKNAKPSWQTSATACSGKANADVSAVADPNTGVAVYDSTPNQGSSGWLVFGGTSASSPIVASAYAIGGAHGVAYPAQYTWQNAGSLNDVTSGSNGHCRTKVWCQSTTGWDGPTGLGTPNGTGSF